MKIKPAPLGRIDAALAEGTIRHFEAALQKTYYLLSDPRYDSKKYGEMPEGSLELYDCSATVEQRSLSKWRDQTRNFDPYGLLWKLWLDEADRIRKQGEEIPLGHLDGIPIRLRMPNGRFHGRAPPYEEIASRLATFLERYGGSLSSWAKEVFGKVKVKTWSGPLIWPPEFLKDSVPYVGSYFDTHPIFNASRTKKWSGPLEKFLKAVGIRNESIQGRTKETPAWIWVISDRARRNQLVWDEEQSSFLVISARCLDGVMNGDWQRSRWQEALYEMVMHELMLAYYLNGRTRSFMRDPVMDAVIRGVAQSHLRFTGPLYRHGPFFDSKGGFHFSDDEHVGYERYRSAPLWDFLYRMKGDKFIKKYIRSARLPSRYLKRYIDKKDGFEDLRLAFAAWGLSLKRTPERLRGGISISSSNDGLMYPKDIELKPISPPKGSIGAAESPFRAQSFRFFHSPINDAEKVGAINVRWEPTAPKLSGYLFLARKRSKSGMHFLDFTPVKPGASQQVFLDPAQKPTDIFFVVINSSDESYPGESLQLQISVVPHS